MRTPGTRSVVSLATALTITLALGACGSARPRHAPDETVRADVQLPAFAFDNYAREHVHVYLVGERREWLLGRVEPMGRASLRIPYAALIADRNALRLVVLVGERATLRASEQTRATMTMAQSAAVIFTHRWAFFQTAQVGQLSALRLEGVRQYR